MALNLTDRIAVLKSQTMLDRCEGSVRKYALYILGNGASTAEQLAWARGAMDDLAVMARRVSNHLFDDTNFIAGGTDITEVQLQGACEAAINTRFIAAA